MNFRNGILWLDPSEIEDIATEALDGAKWPRLSSHPKAIDIDRVITRHLKIEPAFVDLPDGILGQTKFSRDGKSITIEISAALADEANAEIKGSVHRYRTTAAHEVGHALIHPCLYVDDELNLFAGRPATPPTTLCREQAIGRYNKSDWREWQANQAMSCLLMPRRDVLAELKTLPTAPSRDGIIRHLSSTFLVSQEVARYRLERISPASDPAQLPLG